MSKKLVQQVKSAFRVSTPIVQINTTDQEQTLQGIVKELCEGTTVVQWDFVRGFRARNKFSADFVRNLVGSDDESVGNPVIALEKVLDELPKKGVVFLINAHLWLDQEPVRQAIWNLREAFKRSRRMLVLLCPDHKPSAELAGDVVVLDEPLPERSELEELVRTLCGAANVEIDDATVERAVEAIQGLPAFQAEQVVAMSLSRDGLDIDALWDRKRKQIEQTPGLSVNREGVTFEQIGGVSEIKDYVRRIMAGKSKPGAVVFLDEIEKMLGGAQGDTSGVTQDQLGSLLSYMQDNYATGLIFVGPPGAAKSAVAKAAGNSGGVPTIALDLGGAKGSLVGQSEQQLRTALKVISAVSNGRSLWVATCNSIHSLPPELKRRFKRGIFFFDLPSAEEREAIWQIYESKYELSEQERPDDSGWTGAEIEQCCFTAWDLDISLVEAATKVVPVARSNAKGIEALRNLASGTFLSASHPGVYEREESEYEIGGDAGRELLEV